CLTSHSSLFPYTSLFRSVGVHTGDSIVVAPIQTLEAHAIHMLKDASLTIVRELGIIGACNVQLAYHPKTNEYRVIEVNPRVNFKDRKSTRLNSSHVSISY